MNNPTSNERCPHGISLTSKPPCHFCEHTREVDRLQESLQANITVSKARHAEIERLRAALEHLSLYVAANGDDWVQKTAREYLNGATPPTLSSMQPPAVETTHSWQPIHTAPQHYTPVLLKQGDVVGEGCFHHHLAMWEFCNPSHMTKRAPTHWKPLPSAEET